MIDDGMRAGLLEQFPSAVPLTVVACGTEYYARAAAQRPGLTVLSLAAGTGALPAIADSNVVVDGLDRVREPGNALRAVRNATSGARLFALISNGAFGTTLLNFLAGDRLDAEHPLVAGELEALFAAGGWQIVDRTPLIDRSFAHGPIPYAISTRGITLKVTTPEIAERLSTAGFFVVANPQ